MSDSPAKSAPLITVLTVLAGFALFLVVVYKFYLPHQTGPFTGDGIHTAEQRKENLAKLHEKQAKQATTYGWVDQKAGVVQLPLERAMDLTLQQYGTKH
ncbi:MAG TPA: hypothetical protein PLU52_10480 [Opitutaceae bacterium]|mgnify:CR=1 FL=1|nr:hypothetical protein [Opitutaceae bacterium]HND60708.1 hypothetical protein [Opitutaceae bacterium]